MKDQPVSLKRWAGLMGRDLPRSKFQPLQPVRVNRKGEVELTLASMGAMGFSSGDRVGVQIVRGVCTLGRCVRGGAALAAGEKLRFPVAEKLRRRILPAETSGAVLVGTKGEGRIFPIIVREHGPDVLGPRFIDELCEDRVIRHAVPGLPRDGWTPEALGELETLLCAEPFRVDPVAAIAGGSDWVGWMTRNRVLGRSSSRDSALRESFIRKIFCLQKADGSWGSVPATGYATLGLLSLGRRASDERLKRAAKWLLDLPEPPPRPGMS